MADGAPGTTAADGPLAGRSDDPTAGSTTQQMGAVQVGRAAQVLFAVLLGGAILLLVAMAMAVRRPAGGPRVGAPAPDFELVTFDGEMVRLSELRGKVVVVNFWASWCKSCEEEARELEAIWREYRDQGVVVVGVDYVDTRPAALAYLERFDITYPNGPDRGDRISRAYRLRGVPETLVIDPEGLVVPLWLRGAESPVERLAGPLVPGSSFGPADLRALLDELTAGTSDD